ncbi:MAG: M3 family oligoendopeptidase [Solirubrobacterales bacterium]
MEPTTETPEPALAQDASEVAWELDDLLTGAPGVADQADAAPADAVDRLLDEATERSERFAGTHQGSVAELDADGMAAAMRDLEAISELASRAGNYAQLRFATDTADPERGALMQRVRERGTAISTRLLFFELEWAAIEDARAEELLANDALEFCRHHLRSERRYRPHLLSEPEERVMTEKHLTGRSAWGRLFAELTSAIRVTLPDVARNGDDATSEVPLDSALSNLTSPDRDVRAAVAEAVTESLQPGLRTRAYLFNTLLADKAVDDRLRDYPHWLATRNLANEASDESVQALVDAVTSRYEIARRWYRLKAQILGVDTLADYDRMATLTLEEPEIAWPQARGMVLEAYRSFSPALADAAQRFFTGGWIDAPVRDNKRGGAFCAYAVPSVHPYVMLNWTSKSRDVLTLAHELGHGVHAYLAAGQGLFHQGTPLTLAETASVFGEELVFANLLEQADTPAERLTLLAESIEGSIATVFRQISMNRFEHSVHTARRDEGELAVERISELWTTSQTDLFGDSVEVTDNYASWWSYVPHFINTPGYVYAYAYGQLLALSVYRRYQEEGPDFEPRYRELLAAGGSRPPEELGQIVGIDLADPGFWNSGLDLVEGQLEQAEKAAREAGHLDG